MKKLVALCAKECSAKVSSLVALQHIGAPTLSAQPSTGKSTQVVPADSTAPAVDHAKVSPVLL